MNRTQRVLFFLQQRPFQWVPAIELEAPGGRQAWRSRVAEARQIAEAQGAKIENRQERRPNVTLSFYRYVPPQPKGQQDLLRANEVSHG